jgi:hypothetical protein
MRVSLAVFLTVLVVLLQGRADPEIHLVPAAYAGEVTIAFRAANGEPLVADGPARVYTIPDHGILLTQAEPNVGSSPAWQFFAVGQNGGRVPIQRIWASTVRDTPENRSATEVEIFYPRRGRTQAGRAQCDVEYDQYFVGTRAQLLAWDSDASRRRLGEYLRENFVCR